MEDKGVRRGGGGGGVDQGMSEKEGEGRLRKTCMRLDGDKKKTTQGRGGEGRALV